jgi:hypothetical protein
VLMKSPSISFSLVNSAALAGLLWCFPSTAAAGQHFETGVALYYFDYVEDCPPPLKSTEEDLILGSYAAYTYAGDENSFFGRLRLEFAYAATAYDGTDQKGTPLKGTTVNGFITGEINLGYQLTSRSKSSFHLTPYSGIGYKFRYRDLGSYSEEYSWGYVPLGLLLEKDFGNRWSVALDASLRFMFDGQIKVNFSNYNSGLNNPKGNLGDKTGYKLAMPLIYHVGQQWAIALTPWYEFSALGRCEPFPIIYNGKVIGAAYEPDSETHQYGADLGVRIFF